MPEKGYNMDRPPHTPYGAKREISNGRGQEATLTTAEPMLIRSTKGNKRIIMRTDICGNPNEPIKAYGRMIRILHQQYTSKI